MANYSKPFNFRNGVQVDNDNFVVDSAGRVGIGTTRPQEFLDIYGNSSGALRVYGVTKTVGLTTTDTLYAGIATIGVLTTTDLVNTGILTTAQLQVGNSPAVSNLIGYGFTAWITTASSTGIHTFGPVGIKTANPDYIFQIEENPLTSTGIGMTNGDIFASGIVSATTFYGDIVGDITGDLTGVASTATKLENSRNFSITGDLESSVISFDGTANVSFASTLSTSFSANTSGIITATKFVGIVTATEAGITTATITNATITNANVGVGTFDSILIQKLSGDVDLSVKSKTNASVGIGSTTDFSNSSGELVYNVATGRLELNNNSTGEIRINLHNGVGAGDTQGFSVRYDNTKLLEVTYDGKVGVNRGANTLTRNFEVGGDMFVSNDAKVSGIMTIGSGLFEVTFGDGSSIPMPDTQNFNTISGISTFKNLNIADQLTVGQGVTMNSKLYVGGTIGIGTTSDTGFVTGPSNLGAYIEGSLYSQTGFYTKGTFALTTKADASVHTDDRVIPSSPIDYGAVVPFIDYGNFQIESGATSLITENVLLVPTIGAATVGFGTTNGGITTPNLLAGGNGYLTKVGINTYYARGLIDMGVTSTAMNSYLIPPTLTQSELDDVATLWNTPSAPGYATANKVTPNGVVPGAIVYNSTTDNIQIRNSATSFRNLSPVVAFATVDSGSLVSSDGYNLSLTNNLTNAIFSFSNALQSADYTVMVSAGSITESYTVPEAQKTTTGFRITFSPSNANTQSYSVMILQV